jgi:hypothetical protein
MRADGAARGGANWVKTRCVGHGAYARPRMHALEGGVSTVPSGRKPRGIIRPKRAAGAGRCALVGVAPWRRLGRYTGSRRARDGGSAARAARGETAWPSKGRWKGGSAPVRRTGRGQRAIGREERQAGRAARGSARPPAFAGGGGPPGRCCVFAVRASNAAGAQRRPIDHAASGNGSAGACVALDVGRLGSCVPAGCLGGGWGLARARPEAPRPAASMRPGAAAGPWAPWRGRATATCKKKCGRWGSNRGPSRGA